VDEHAEALSEMGLYRWVATEAWREVDKLSTGSVVLGVEGLFQATRNVVGLAESTGRLLQALEGLGVQAQRPRWTTWAPAVVRGSAERRKLRLASAGWLREWGVVVPEPWEGDEGEAVRDACGIALWCARWGVR
jgi:hypothetical protein